MTAAQLGQTVQAGTKSAADNFNRFVEGDERLAPRSGKGPAPEKQDFWDSFGDAPKGPSTEKKDFWDDFAAAGEVAQTKATPAKPTSIGTMSMKKTPGQEKEGWGDW